MAHHTIIYGRINGATWKTEDFYKLHQLNLSVINSLSENDTYFPYINKSMFSIPDNQGTFRNQVITFGASYKSLEYEWHLWIKKFESILKRLFWFDVIIHAEFEMMGTYTYQWSVDNDQLNNWYKKSPDPISEWNFESNGPRSFLNELNSNDS